MKYTDILSTDPETGRALLRADGYPVSFVLPNHLRDFHAMNGLQKWAVGALTPAQVLRDGIAVNELAMSLGDARFQVRTILHETCGHWWEMWRRMGPGDWPATYSWQTLLTLGRVGSAHLHRDHPQEVKARWVGDAIMLETDDLLRFKQPLVFDTLPWLAVHFPALRS